MKYYIPTSSLNFNNILSSESISPMSVYEKRGFGYKTWTPVEENGEKDRIKLYDAPFAFERHNDDVEDHPMWIEIESQIDFKRGEYVGEYYSKETIYINMWSTKFIFLSEQDLRTVWTMSDSSKETKAVRLYKEKRMVVNSALPSRHDRMQRTEQPQLDDRKADKMKGLLYGYYIGAALSTNKEEVERRNTLTGLQSIICSAMSNKGEIKQAQEEQFNKLINSLSGSEARNIEAKNENSLKWIANEIAKLDFQAEQNSRLLKPEDEEIVVTDLSVKHIAEKYLSETEQNVLKAWINDILPDSNRNDGTMNGDLSKKLVIKAKEQVANMWAGSDIQKRLNYLNKFVNGDDGYSIDSVDWNDLLTASCCAMLAENDNWEDMLNLMKAHGMTNFRIAFALYGELYGYAELTRDFTDILYGMADKDYIASVYKEINGQVLGEYFYTPQVEQTPKEELTPILKKLKERIDYIEPEERFRSDLWRKLENTSRMERDVQNPQAFMYILNDFIDPESEIYKALDKPGFTKDTNRSFDIKEELVTKAFNILKNEGFEGKQLEEGKEAIREAAEIEDLQDSELAFMYILNDLVDKESTRYMRINEVLGNPLKLQQEIKPAEPKNVKTTYGYIENPMNFDQPRANGEKPLLIYEHEKAWKELIESLLPEEQKKEGKGVYSIREDWKWFWGEMEKDGNKRSSRKDVDSRDNNRVIMEFVNLKSKGRYKALYFTEELRKKIYAVLMEHYGNNR